MDVDRRWLCQRIVERAGDAAVFADADGVIRLWNEAAERVFGYPAEEAVGESLDLIVPEEYRDRHWTGFDRAVETGETQFDHGELLSVPARRADGERISIEFTESLLRDGDEVVGVVALVHDVTERWEREREREERIEELEAELDRLRDEQ